MTAGWDETMCGARLSLGSTGQRLCVGVVAVAVSRLLSPATALGSGSSVPASRDQEAGPVLGLGPCPPRFQP